MIVKRGVIVGFFFITFVFVTLLLIVFALPPDDPVPLLVSVNKTNSTVYDLNGTATLTDPEADTMNVTVEWYRNDVWNLTVDYNNSYVNGTLFSAVLGNGNYKWFCLARDNASHQRWGDVYNVNVTVSAELSHDMPGWMVNNVNTSRYVFFSYSEYLNNSLILGNLTIYEADGEFYYAKNMSNSSKFSGNSLIFHPQLVNITPYEIFDGDFTVNNTAGLNFSIKYHYKGIEYETKDNVTITIYNETQW